MSQSVGPVANFYSIIPAGGIGSRLWPLSRANAPKFLHDLSGSGASLLRDTWDRLLPISGANVMVVTGRPHRAAVQSQLPELSDENTVLENEPKDSTAAIGLAAAILNRRHPGVIVGSFAADHVISPDHRFHAAVREAIQVASTGLIATIGIVPTEPAVGYGYIRAGNLLGLKGSPNSRSVLNYKEKPDLPTATAYLSSGEYFWNAGMFIARAEVLLEQIGEVEPMLRDGLEELGKVWDTPLRAQTLDRVWPKLKRIAIDYTVAEPGAAAGKLGVVPGEFEWHDMGDFASIARLHNGGRSGPLAILGKDARVLADSSSGIVIAESGRLISIVGVKGIVVVDTPDALLVTTSEHAQRVKSVVDVLRAEGAGDVL